MAKKRGALKSSHFQSLNLREKSKNVKNNTMEETKKSTTMDWVLTAVSLVVTVALIIFLPEWFWVGLPFLLTYFVRALGYM